jgi:hypothetical protein
MVKMVKICKIGKIVKHLKIVQKVKNKIKIGPFLLPEGFIMGYLFYGKIYCAEI